MIKNYKKGDSLSVTYKGSNESDHMQSVGIIFSVSDSEITLAHSFSGLRPIDSTKISTDKILDIEYVKPKETNSLEDLKL